MKTVAKNLNFFLENNKKKLYKVTNYKKVNAKSTENNFYLLF